MRPKTRREEEENGAEFSGGPYGEGKRKPNMTYRYSCFLHGDFEGELMVQRPKCREEGTGGAQTDGTS